MRHLLLFALFAAYVATAQGPATDKWAEWQPFLGTWEGAGSGAPGQGSGRFSFTRELQGAVLVRRNYAEYPATKDKPAYRHDDLMVIYPEGHAGIVRADYWDNEGHVIPYAPRFSEDGRKLIFESSDDGPRYRLTYTKMGKDELQLTFEIAPAAAPQQFKTYIEARATRAK